MSTRAYINVVLAWDDSEIRGRTIYRYAKSNNAKFMSLPVQRIMKIETLVTPRHKESHLLKTTTHLCREYYPTSNPKS